jgi:hypothetical protein
MMAAARVVDDHTAASLRITSLTELDPRKDRNRLQAFNSAHRED